MLVPDKNLLEYSLTALNAASHAPARRELETIFRNLRLPIPGPSEYWHYFSGRSLSFLNDYGVTLRILPTEMTRHIASLPHHPLVERKLAEFQGKYFTAELRAGVHVGDSPNIIRDSGDLDDILAIADPAEKSAAYKKWLLHGSSENEEHLVDDILLTDGIYHSEPSVYNRGYIPVKTVDFPRGVPVMLDPKYFHEKSELMVDLVHPITRRAQAAVDQFYQPANDVVESAWKNGKMPNPHKMDKMWAGLSKLREDGVLIPGWLNEPRMQELHDTFDTIDGTILQSGQMFIDMANNYGARVKRFQAGTPDFP